MKESTFFFFKAKVGLFTLAADVRTDIRTIST